jgi:hypothetical protein
MINNRVILFACIGLLIVAGAVIIYMTSASSQKSVPQTTGAQQSSSSFPPYTGPKANKPVPTISPLSPEQVTAAFYTWYISYPGSPLSSGAYKTSSFLTSDFIQTITGLYSQSPGSDPVICVQNRTKDVSYAKATYDSTGQNAQVMIVGSQNGQNLQSVILKKIAGKWLIDDIDCEL